MDVITLGDLQGTLPCRIVLRGMEPASLDWLSYSYASVSRIVIWQALRAGR